MKSYLDIKIILSGLVKREKAETEREKKEKIKTHQMEIRDISYLSRLQSLGLLSPHRSSIYAQNALYNGTV